MPSGISSLVCHKSTLSYSTFFFYFGPTRTLALNPCLPPSPSVCLAIPQLAPSNTSRRRSSKAGRRAPAKGTLN